MHISYATKQVFHAAFFALILFICNISGAYAQSSGSERRVALVVGNAAYKMGPLKNPGNDARAIAATLRRLNFEVIERQNVTRESFAISVREFGDKLKGATVGLFYFAGHGLQVKGRNFLVPVDADIAREDEVPYRGIDVNEVLDKMDSARTPVNLVLLDACRNNPFARSFKLSQLGLAQMDAPAGTLIAFATSPGSVAQDGEGDNGMYTAALLKHIAEASLPIEQMLKRVRVDVVRATNSGQVPWESSSLNRDFYFAPTPSKPTAAPATDDLTLELAFWDAVKNSTSPADYRAYLEQYPKGRFSALARVRAGAAPAVPVTSDATAKPLITEHSKPLRADSPEGLYSAVFDAGVLRFIDAGRRALKQLTIDRGTNVAAQQLQFSSDGRWLALSGLRDGRPVQLLISVPSGKVLWERDAVGLVFDTAQPALKLRMASGDVQSVALPSAEQQ